MWLLINSGCEKEIEYDGKALDNFLVLNAQLEADSLIRCHLTRSNTILDKMPIQHIGDAKVELYKNGTLLEVLAYDKDGYYKSLMNRAFIGNEYEIRVDHPRYNQIFAKTTVLTRSDTDYASVKYSHATENLHYTVQLNDLEGEDFYRLQVLYYSTFYDYDGNEVTGWRPCYFESDDPVLNNNKVVGEDSDFSDDPDNDYAIFNDDLFDGEIYHLKFEVGEYNCLEKLKDIQVNVQRLSKDMYKYYKSVQTRDYYDGDPFVEPVRVYTNVNGGAGIVGSATSNYMRFDPNLLEVK